MRSVRALVVVLSLTFLPSASPAAVSGFVSASGSQLQVNGQPWRAVGVNLWDMDAVGALAGNPSVCTYQRTDLDAYLDASFKQIATHTHATAVRTFGFIDSYTNGGKDWSSTDKLLFYAQRYNIRVIPVLGDQYGACNGPASQKYKKPSWYHCSTPGCVPGFKENDMWGTSYYNYAVAAATRYKNNPTIAFWQLMNEAVSDQRQNGGVVDQTALVDFSRDMTTAIRAVDPNHLISLGTLGGGASHLYVGSQLGFYGALLDCGPTGGCIDIAEQHQFDRAEALQGVPMTGLMRAKIVWWDAPGNATPIGSAPILGVDGVWVNLSATLPASAVRWSLRFDVPVGEAWTAQIDDAQQQTTTGVALQSFETGTEGWTAGNGVISKTTVRARTGVSSLAAQGAARSSAGTVDIDAPPIAPGTKSVQLFVRQGFHGPTQAQDGSKLAHYMHQAISAHNKPFILGEVGIQALAPGASPRGAAPALPNTNGAGTCRRICAPEDRPWSPRNIERCSSTT